MVMDYPKALRGAASPAEARPAGQEACRQISPMLERVAQALLLKGSLPERDDRTLGLGAVAQIAAELSKSTITLLDVTQGYGAAALLRQLVEVEYLSWAFACDPEEAFRWVRAGREEREKLFQPKVLRKRSEGQFRAEEYWTHCNRGGHPHPDGAQFLPTMNIAGFSAELYRGRGIDELWDDFVIHLVDIWEYLLQALRDHPINEFLKDEALQPVTSAIESWSAAAAEARSHLMEQHGEADVGQQ